MASIDELWLVDFGDPYPSEPGHHRPALVLGPPDTFGAAFPVVMVAPLTMAARGLSLHVEVEATRTSGLRDPSYVQCELVRSVDKRRLVHRLGAVDSETSRRVAEIILTLLNY